MWTARKKWNHAKSREITREKFENNSRNPKKKGFAICTKDCKPKVRELLFETFREWNHAKSREVTRGNGGEMTTSHRWIYGWITFFNQIIAETGSETSHTSTWHACPSVLKDIEKLPKGWSNYRGRFKVGTYLPQRISSRRNSRSSSKSACSHWTGCALGISAAWCIPAAYMRTMGKWIHITNTTHSLEQFHGRWVDRCREVDR